ncbi:MAG: hypothetical protein FWD82_08480 [Defluviitaleaceae bacterium]|nr:hypothetical protein [Defluviitaleaceae bacterium]
MIITTEHEIKPKKQWFLAIALFVSLSGSFMSMLRWELGPIVSLFKSGLRFSGILDGFRLIFNRLFVISEQYQAYRYVMFTINSPESAWEQNISMALFVIVIFFAIFSVFLMYIRRKATIFVAIILVTGIQVYFGVFPSAVWNIALFFVFALMFIRKRDRKENFHGYVAIASIFVLVWVTVLAIYPNFNPHLHEFSESFRDLFGERISQSTNASHNTQSENFEYEPEYLEVSVTDVRSDSLHEASYEDYTVESDERAGGAEVGTVIMQQSVLLPLILLLITAIVIIATIHFAPKLVKAAKRRKMFDKEGCKVAINSMFVYIIDWLVAHGLQRENVVFSIYTEKLSELISLEYSKEYKNIEALWCKAMYSEQEIGEAEKQQVGAFLNKTREIVWKNSSISQKIRIKLHYFL